MFLKVILFVALTHSCEREAFAPPPRNEGASLDPKEQKKGKKENPDLFCAACNDKLEANHIGVRCLNSHHLCPDCTVSYKNHIMGDLSTGVIPPKCGFCGAGVTPSSFERQLNDDELAQYLSFVAMTQLEDNEMLVSCPFCPFFCTRVVGPGGKSQALFLHCDKSDCRKVSCTLCLKECVGNENGDDEDGDEATELGMEEHFQCAIREEELGGLRKRFQDALETGNKRVCPGCGHSGIKDDSCTHMTCEACGITWCFVCGKDTASDDCSKSVRTGLPEYRHNDNWAALEGRCPMFLSDIQQLDPSWPRSDDEAMAMLLRKTCLRNLQILYKEIGQEQYRRLTETFPEVGPASGYTEEDIQGFDIDAPLFQRDMDYYDRE